MSETETNQQGTPPPPPPSSEQATTQTQECNPEGASQNSQAGSNAAGNNGPTLQTHGSFQANNSTLANQIFNETRNSYHHHETTAEGSSTSVSLSPNHFEAFGQDRLGHLLQDLLFDRGQLEHLVGTLEEFRIIALVGRPEMGKTSLALLAAARLMQRCELRGALLCRGLDGNVRVDPNELTGDEPEYRQRVVIIKNAFSRARSDLSRFVDGLTGSRLESYRERLAASDSFLVLTASQGGITEGMSPQGVLQRVPPPPPSLLCRGLNNRVQRWLQEPRSTKEGPDASTIEALLCGQEEQVAARLGSLSRIDRFVKEYLPGVAAGRLSLFGALERIDDLDRWLLNDLPSDPETWYAVLSLTLCSAAPMAQSVPWLQFETLRRTLAWFLSRELHETRQARTIQDLCQGWTLSRARAVIVRSSYPEPQGIRFENAEYPNLLWRVLLGEGRSLLSLLLPLLRELASGEDAHLRQAATRILGRMGQIDPLYLIQPFIRKIRKEKSGIPLGHLYQGILGAEDSKYCAGCLVELRDLLRSEGEEAPLALRALRQIGLLDLSFAMKELQAVAEARLEIRWSDLRQTNEGLRLAEELIRNVKNPREVIQKLRQWFESLKSDEIFFVIGDLVDRVEDPEQVARAIRKFREDSQWLLTTQLVAKDARKILAAIQLVVVGLFDSLSDDGPLLRELLAWLRSGKKDAGPLVCFLFLHPGGLAPFLKDLSTATEGADRRFCSSILHTARNDAESAAMLRDLLEEVFRQMTAFPGTFRHQMEERFRLLLSAWAREGRDLPSIRPVVVNLLAGFFESHHEELSAWVLRLARDPETKKETEALKALAIEAITSRRSKAQRAVSAA